MAKNVLEELLIGLGVEVDAKSSSELKKFMVMTAKAGKNLIKVATAATVATTAIVYFVKKISESVDAMGKSAEVIGISVEQLDALGFAAEIATGKSDGLAGSMKRLSRIAAEALTKEGGGAGAVAFGRLDISPLGVDGVKKADVLLLEIADKLSLIEDSALRLDLAEQLGLGGLDLLLKLGSGGMQELIDRGKELAIVTAEDAKRAAEFNDALSKSFGRIIKGVSVLIASSLSPALTELADKFSEWFIKYKELISLEIEEFLKTLISVIKLFFDTVKIGTKLIYALIKSVGGLSNAFKIFLGIVGIFTAVNFVLLIQGVIGAVKMLIPLIKLIGTESLIAQAKMFAWLIAVGALIGIILLLFEEMWVSIKGGDTFFGELMKKFPKLEAAIMPIADLLVALYDTFEDLFNLLTNPLDASSWKKFFDGLINLFKTLVSGIKKEIMALLDVFELKKPLQNLKKQFSETPQWEKKFFKKLRKGTGKVFDFFGDLTGFNLSSVSGDSLPKINTGSLGANGIIGGNTSHIMNNNRTAGHNITIGEITIPINSNVAESKEGIKKAVENGINDALRTAMGNLESGVIA